MTRSLLSGGSLPVAPVLVPVLVPVLILALTLAMSPPARAQEPLRAVGSPYPPFRILAQDAPMGMTGIHPEVIQAVAQCLGTTATYANLPLRRALGELREGSQDVYLGLLKTPEREAILIYVDPPYRTDSHKAFYVRKGEGHRVTSFDDLKHLPNGVGMSKGSKYFRAFDESTEILKEPANNTLLSLRMLLAGRVDAVIATDGVGDYIVRENGLEELVEQAPYGYFEKVPAYLTLSRSSRWADRVEEIQACMSSLVEDGTLEHIIETHLRKYEIGVGSALPPPSP